MNADFTRLSANFVTIDTDLNAIQAAVGILQTKLANVVGPSDIASVATQSDGFATRIKTALDSLTLITSGL